MLKDFLIFILLFNVSAQTSKAYQQDPSKQGLFWKMVWIALTVLYGTVLVLSMISN